MKNKSNLEKSFFISTIFFLIKIILKTANIAITTKLVCINPVFNVYIKISDINTEHDIKNNIKK